MDIESIRKRLEPMRRTAKHMPAIMDQNGRDLIALMDEVDRLSEERDAARTALEAARVENHATAMLILAEEHVNIRKAIGLPGDADPDDVVDLYEITKDERDAARAEVEKLRAAGKEMIDAMLTGVRVITPIEPQDQRAIDASKEFCSLIGAEMLREQKVENEKLRAELEALRAPVTDAELAEVEREHASDHQRLRDGHMPTWAATAHSHRGALLRALKAERVRYVDKCTEADSYARSMVQMQADCDEMEAKIDEAHAAIWGLLCAVGNYQIALLLHPCGSCTCYGEGSCAWCEITALKEDGESLRALVEQCRPVVEAVLRYQEAENWQDSHKAQRDLRNLDLPTMPEVKP